MITIEQCRAARGILDWTQQDLADAAGLSKTAINNFEKGHSDIKNESLRAIRMAFESADIEFLKDEGLRRKSENTQILKGPEAFSELLDDIHKTLKEDGGEILIANMDEGIASQTSPKKLLEHLEQLKENNIKERILCAEGRKSLLLNEMSCRWLTRNLVQMGMTTFIYGSKVAFELWDHSMIIVVQSRDAATAERARFETLWAGAAVPPGQKAAANL